MINLTTEEAHNLLRALSRVEGYMWSIKDNKDEINEMLYAWTNTLADKLKAQKVED